MAGFLAPASPYADLYVVSASSTLTLTLKWVGDGLEDPPSTVLETWPLHPFYEKAHIRILRCAGTNLNQRKVRNPATSGHALYYTCYVCALYSRALPTPPGNCNTYLRKTSPHAHVPINMKSKRTTTTSICLGFCKHCS